MSPLLPAAPPSEVRVTAHEDELLPAGAIATRLHISTETIRYWVREGRLAHRGTDRRGRCLYDLAEVAAFVTGPRRHHRGSAFRDETAYLDALADRSFGPFEPADYNGDRP